ncbi:hypothetical protein CYMTET_39993 [Cymbomonas tetramitiformis]|uniref:LysM domain-containing protein n=1 Tax=Cymbomonas tetramitiformis TaxID=36881 RepID=A0AAE0C8Y0_9CHLO|nr:hypothetical protein CYMTET_39993 [Cymbomonas tetramitiformis]
MEEGMLPPFSSLPAVLDHMPQPKPRGPYTGNSIRTKQRRAAKAAGKENQLVEYKKKIDNEKEVVACGTQTEIQPDRVSCGTQTEELPIERVSCETQTTATVPPDIELAIFSQNISSATGTGVTSLDSASNDNSPATNKTKQKRKKKRVRKKTDGPGKGCPRAARKTEVSQRQSKVRTRWAREILQPAVAEASKCFGNDLSARALAVSKAAERASGPHTLFGAKSHDAISDKGKAVLAKEARDNLKREINNPTKWGSALAKGGISFKQANIFAKEVLPKGAKPANNKITQSNKTILEVMERLLPITETASGGGYQVNVQKFFSLILPTYYRRLKEKMFPPTLLETLDPETDEYMHRDLFEHEKELLRDAICDWDFSFDAASSKTRKVTFTSFVVSPKIEGLEEEWQSPKSCYNVLQLDGKDKAENLELNCLELFDLVQELEDNTPVTCWLEGEEVELVIRLHYPADMASHWAWMRAGGGTHDEADFCHRCKCKGKEKGHVFDTYCIQAGDTTQSIADAHDIFAAELRLINPKDKTMEAKLKDLHCNKQRKFTPQLTTFPEDTMALLPVGKKIRVHKQWPMDRVCPDAFVKFPHIKAMFCWLHAGMRVTEFLVTKLQQRAVHHKLVDALNAAWMDEGYKTYYQMKKSPETGEYYKASFNGIQVKRMIQHAQHWAAVVDDREAILALFQEWKDIYEVGRKLCPSASEMADFGKRCRTFFRCVRMAYTDENIAMYLHAVGCHAGDYMRVEPLGKHMNEHLEAHHIITWQYYRHGFRGGTPGNPYAVKNEDGTFKGGERTHTHQSQNVCKSILETQNRLLFLDIAKDWDESVWSAVGLTKPPEDTDMAEFFKQEAPKAQLVPATQALRRTKRKIEKTEEECRNVKRTLAADHPTVLRVQHRLDSLKKSLLPRKKSIVASLVEKAKKIARKAHLHDR